MACAIAAAFALPSLDKFDDWKKTYGKNYATSTEEKNARTAFYINREAVLEHNMEYAQGERTFALGMNKFSDKSIDEYRKMVSRPMGTGRVCTPYDPPHDAAKKRDASVNWVKKGLVTPVKNQGQCGSCWSFSSTGSIEGQYARHHELVSLSEQYLMDCSYPEGDNSCEGGLMDYAFKFVMEHGITTEADYSYKAQDEECRKNVTTLRELVVVGCQDIDVGNSDDLKTAIDNIGPISVAINAGLQSFQLYQEGIYSDPDCTADLDHGVLAVGYGTENGQPYFLVKNSWGEDWGEQGYIKILDQNNLCGIATSASFPQVCR